MSTSPSLCPMPKSMRTQWDSSQLIWPTMNPKTKMTSISPSHKPRPLKIQLDMFLKTRKSIANLMRTVDRPMITKMIPTFQVFSLMMAGPLNFHLFHLLLPASNPFLMKAPCFQRRSPESSRTSSIIPISPHMSQSLIREALSAIEASPRRRCY